MPELRRGPGRVMQVSAGLLRASLAVAMQYRSDFWLDALTGVLRAFAAIAPIALVFGHRTEIVGWTAPEATLVVGLFFLMQGLLQSFVEPNLGEVVEAIRSGSLDFLLLKPADAQLLASVRRLAPGHLWDLAVAAALCGWSLSSMGMPSAPDVAVAGLMLLSGLAAMYGVWLLAICTSFWFVRVDNLRYLLWAATDAGRWPLDVFAPWVRFVLLTLVPVGILTTFPALALRGEWTWGTVAVGGTVGLAFLILSRLAWNRALSSYTSASS